MKFIRSACLFAVCVFAFSSWGFQLAPMGSKFESKLTNETNNWLSSVAGRIGVLLKEPVHEEITQLAFGCPADAAQLGSDVSCQGADQPFANPFIIYGVRWNDLPPFMLDQEEGKTCKKILNPLAAACNVSQTVRFSTQPDCWFCLFKQAGVTAQTSRISKCQKGDGYVQGNLMTRSHFGDLQFLHAMASNEGESPEVTRQKILDWLQFAWKVASKEIKSETLLKNVDIPGIREHFGCTEWSVSDIYVLGRKDKLLPRLHEIAFGSVLHTIQDSFAGGHSERAATSVASDLCIGKGFVGPRPVVEFHSYGDQDGHKHDAKDERGAMVVVSDSQWPEAVDATRNLFELYDRNATWEVAKPYMECALALHPNARVSSAGEDFRR